MSSLPQEISIELGGIELDIFYDINPMTGINILAIYHQNFELSHYLNHYAVADIKTAIWDAIN